VDPVEQPDTKGKQREDAGEPAVARRVELEAGKLVIGKGAETLVLTVTGLTHPDGSLMDLSHLTLTRTGDVPAAKTTP